MIDKVMLDLSSFPDRGLIRQWAVKIDDEKYLVAIKWIKGPARWLSHKNVHLTLFQPGIMSTDKVVF